tara:strand:+ start:967 stop:1197 length:231 start_codon:yes stop_codon:yes gene_type:complete
MFSEEKSNYLKKYECKNGGIHDSYEVYLEGLVIDLKGTISGKDVVIQDLLEHIKKTTGTDYYQFLRSEEGWPKEEE